MLNSFFSFFILVFSTLAFAGGTEWKGTTVHNDNGTPNKANDDWYYPVVETENDAGDSFWLSTGNATFTKKEAKQAANEQAANMNANGTTVSQATATAKKKGWPFGKDKEKAKLKEIVASPQGDCIRNPTGPDCDPLEGKELPSGSGTKGVKAQ